MQRIRRSGRGLALAAAASLYLGSGTAGAQGAHIEFGSFDVSVPIGQDASRVLKCKSGNLISGGYRVDNDPKNHRAIREYPTLFVGVPHWRVDIRNFGSTDPKTRFHIIVLCSDATSPPTSARVDKDIPPGTLFFARVDQTVMSYDVVNIYSAKTDGTALLALTTSPPGKQFDNAAPAVSPDGSRIAFMTMRHREDAGNGNTSEIYVMAADGAAQTRLTNNAVNDDDPRWCGNDRLMLSRGTSDGTGDIVEIGIVDGNGDGNSDSLMNVVTGATDDYQPDCSPDGTRIVFLRRVSGGHRQIVLVNRDGTGEVVLGGPPAVNEQPRFSPDGKQIVFGSNRADPTSPVRDIYIMDAADADGDGMGDNLIRVTVSSDGSGSSQPVWSPDGQWIFFTMAGPATASLHIADKQGFTVSPAILPAPPSAFAGDWR